MVAARAYEIVHVIGFEETNLVGNVYYVHHLRWQGRCREMFLRDHCPEILDALREDLVLITTRCSCEYFAELFAFDEIRIKMRLGEIAQNRVTMLFEYCRSTRGGEEVVARGEQQIACMRRRGETTTPIPVPREMREALEAFSAA